MRAAKKSPRERRGPAAAWEHRASSRLLASLDILDLEVALTGGGIYLSGFENAARGPGSLRQQAHASGPMLTACSAIILFFASAAI